MNIYDINISDIHDMTVAVPAEKKCQVICQRMAVAVAGNAGRAWRGGVGATRGRVVKELLAMSWFLLNIVLALASCHINSTRQDPAKY